MNVNVIISAPPFPRPLPSLPQPQPLPEYPLPQSIYPSPIKLEPHLLHTKTNSIPVARFVRDTLYLEEPKVKMTFFRGIVELISAGWSKKFHTIVPLQLQYSSLSSILHFKKSIQFMQNYYTIKLPCSVLIRLQIADCECRVRTTMWNLDYAAEQVRPS